MTCTVHSCRSTCKPKLALIALGRRNRYAIARGLQVIRRHWCCDTFWIPGSDTIACQQVLVLRLQTAGSIEERVHALAMQKRMVADTSITGRRCCCSSAQRLLDC